MREHIDSLDSMMNRLEALGMKLEEYMKVAILISSLSEKKKRSYTAWLPRSRLNKAQLGA